MLQNIISSLVDLSTVTPPWLFVGVGTFLEELLGPIPSPIILTITGALAMEHEFEIGYIFFLAILASAMKTFVSLIYYQLANKLEHKLPDSFFRKIGTSKQAIESLGENLSKGKRDDITIFLLRASPISPSGTISIAAGFIGIDLHTFLRSTFLGYIIPTSLYIYIGYTGVDILAKWLHWI